MVSSPISSPATAVAASYEAPLGELDRPVHSMAAGRLPFDGRLDSCRQGCERLEAAEPQVEVLGDGRLRPWTGA